MIVRQFEFLDGNHGVIVRDLNHPLDPFDFNHEGPTREMYILYKAGRRVCMQYTLDDINLYLDPEER